jgi:arylsulfatase A-like enzyme
MTGGRVDRLGRRAGVDTTGVPIQIRAIHDGRYKYARYFDPGAQEEYELYDLHNDPLELHNLAGDPGSKALQQEMSDRLREAEAKEMGPLPREVLRGG